MNHFGLMEFPPENRILTIFIFKIFFFFIQNEGKPFKLLDFKSGFGKISIYLSGVVKYGEKWKNQDFLFGIPFSSLCSSMNIFYFAGGEI